MSRARDEHAGGGAGARGLGITNPGHTPNAKAKRKSVSSRETAFVPLRPDTQTHNGQRTRTPPSSPIRTRFGNAVLATVACGRPVPRTHQRHGAKLLYNHCGTKAAGALPLPQRVRCPGKHTYSCGMPESRRSCLIEAMPAASAASSSLSLTPTINASSGWTP